MSRNPPAWILAGIVLAMAGCGKDAGLKPVELPPASAAEGIHIEVEAVQDTVHPLIRVRINIFIENRTDSTFVWTGANTCVIGFDALTLDYEQLDLTEACGDAMSDVILAPGENISATELWDGKVPVGRRGRLEYLPNGIYFIAGGLQWSHTVDLGDTVALHWVRPQSG